MTGARPVREQVASAWDETELTQTGFATLLMIEARLYGEAPEMARDPARVRDGCRCALCSTSARAADHVSPTYEGTEPVLVCEDHAEALATGAWDGTEHEVVPLFE